MLEKQALLMNPTEGKLKQTFPKAVTYICIKIKSVYTTTEKFENAALFSTVRPTVHTNPSRKWSFLKALFKPKEFGWQAFRFRVSGKHFEKGAFRKR